MSYPYEIRHSPFYLKRGIRKLLLIFISLLGLMGCADQEVQPETTRHLNQAIPSFELVLADGSKFNTGNIGMGKSTVLFYFSPYCPYCRAQMIELIDNLDQVRDINFYMITSFPFEEMKKFYQKYELNKYANMIVGVDPNNYFNQYFEAKGVPALAIYNKNKKLNSLFVGEVKVGQIVKVSEKI
ncbi:MAG: thioredoxin family protein [Chitinophagaceae bacterium]|nr:thioredoxin family protein [Chitinophagaceae bacterium]